MVAKIRVNPYGAVALLLGGAFLLMYWFNGGIGALMSGHAVSVRHVLAVSIQLAERGGREVVSFHKKHQGINARSKEGDELLTDADVASHKQIFYGFAKALPSVKLISEEHTGTRVDFRTIATPHKRLPEVDAAIHSDLFVNSRDMTIWIDPLDATQEFTEEMHKYVSVMVCVVFRGSPIAGVLHFPFSNTTYWSWTGYGMSDSLKAATMQGRKSTANPVPQNVIISRSHTGAAENVLKNVLGSNVAITKAGGSGYKVMSIVKGKSELYYHQTRIKKWDLCAPQAILEATGGTLTDMRGERPTYSETEQHLLRNGVLGSSRKRRIHASSIVNKFGSVARKLANTKYEDGVEGTH